MSCRRFISHPRPSRDSTGRILKSGDLQLAREIFPKCQGLPDEDILIGAKRIVQNREYEAMGLLKLGPTLFASPDESQAVSGNHFKNNQQPDLAG